MLNDLPPDDPRNIWQEQAVEYAPPALDRIHRRAAAYQRKIRFRNSLEYVAVVFIAVFFGHLLWTVPFVTMRVGAGLCIAGGLFMSWQLHRRGSARALPSRLGWNTCLGFHRDELARQRDLLQASWQWYLGPLAPGILVVAIGAGLANPRHLPYVWFIVGGYCALVALAFLGVRRFHRRCARRLQDQMDELDSLEK